MKNIHAFRDHVVTQMSTVTRWHIGHLGSCIQRVQGSSSSADCCHVDGVPSLQIWYVYHFSSVQSLSRVRLFATPWTAAHQASLSITNSWSLLKRKSIESVMPSNHLILCHPLLLLPSISYLHEGLFQWVSSSHQEAKVLEFQLQHQSFKWIFRTDFLWDGLLASLCCPKDSQESSPTP